MSERITTTAANENVLSPDGETLYIIGTDGKVRAYSVDTKALLATWSVGVNLGGADVTADGRYLVIAEREPVSSTLDQNGNRSYVVATYRLDLVTGEVKRFDFSPTSLDHTFFDVAILADGSVLLSQSFRGSGWVNLKTLNLETGAYSTLPISVRQDSIISLTDDRTKVFIAESNISNAEIDLYRVEPGGGLKLLGTNGSSGFNRGVQDISGDGQFTANYVYGAGLLIFDAQLKYVRNLANEFPSWQSGQLEGLAFDAAGKNLYVFDGATKTIVQISTETWTHLRTLPLDPNFTSSFAASGRFGNNLSITDDEDFLIVQTSAGVQRVSIGFDGTPAADILVGTVRSDLFHLEQGGDDMASGGAGNDVLFYGSSLTAADRNDGGDGTDTLVLQGNYADLTLGANSLKNIEGLSLQSGSITRWGQSGTNSYDYNLTFVEANIVAGQQLRVNAQSLLKGEDFTFDGSAETDGGRFLIYAGYGVDVLTGGTGNDIFFFEAGRFGPGDKINGGAGLDAVVISGSEPSTTLLTAEIAANTFTSIEALSFNGRFASDPNAVPSYKVTLKDGNIAAEATLTVNGSSLGATQSLTFDASAVTTGSLNLFGGAGADTLIGGANSDTIYAGGGADTLTGGGGPDLFQFRSIQDTTVSAPDRITDFTAGSDKIDLSRIDANTGADGDQAFTSIGSNAFSKTAGELRYAFDAGTNLWKVEGDINGDGIADFLIDISLAGQSALSNGDFLF